MRGWITCPLALAAGLSLAPAAQADLLVRYKPGVSAGERADARRDAGVHRQRGLAVAGLEAVAPERGVDAGAAISHLRSDPGVLYAEPDPVRRAALVPSDTLFRTQWGLERIAAPAAWDITTGTPQVVVAVADGGADLDHLDLTPNLVPGWDFVDGDASPDDEEASGHGTHVAGTVGARGDEDWACRASPGPRGSCPCACSMPEVPGRSRTRSRHTRWLEHRNL